MVLGIWDTTWFMPGQVSQPHASIERKCAQCHPGFSGTPDSACMACKTGMKFVGDRGIHLNRSEQRCASCHVEHRTRAYPLARAWVDPDKFDHTWTGFDLGRFHKKLITCTKCHSKAQPYSDVAKTCDGCHNDFKPGLWIHDKTECGLDALHSGIDCAQCHDRGWGKGKSPSCARCHPKEGYAPRQICPSN